MKRSALKRKTPMKRGGKLKPRSEKQSARMAEVKVMYRQCFEKNPPCVSCIKRGLALLQATEPHHPQGRKGRNLFNFIPVCFWCHKWIHRNPASATELGLLIPDR